MSKPNWKFWDDAFTVDSESHAGLTKDFTTVSENGAGLKDHLWGRHWTEKVVADWNLEGIKVWENARWHL